MSNKDIFKELYEERINKKNNYSVVLNKIESSSNVKSKTIFKWSFVPLYLIIAIISIIFFSKNEIVNESIIEDNIRVNINELDKLSETILDIDGKVMNVQNYLEFVFLEKINLPSNFTYNNNLEVMYVKGETEKYDLPHTYMIYYYNKNKDKKIELMFSKIGEPLNCIELPRAGEKSKIKDIEVMISHYRDLYLVTFTYNEINFDIKTNGITEKELINLLISII